MKITFKHMNNQSDSKGFTLIELLVSLAISSIVLLLVTQMFISTNEMNTIQENVATVQQDIRAAMDIMSTDILMAGLDPSGTAVNAGFVNGGSDISDTDSNSVAVRYDYDGDGVCEVDQKLLLQCRIRTVSGQNRGGVLSVDRIRHHCFSKFFLFPAGRFRGLSTG